MLQGNRDWTGLLAKFYYQRFYQLTEGGIERSIVRQEEGAQSPFRLEISLSSNAYIVQSLKAYTMADILVVLGGVSNSLYVIGLLCSHFVAKIEFRRQLISELFLYQKPAKLQHVTFHGTSSKCSEL